MALISKKESHKAVYPKTLLSIVASAGGLALFLILASTLLLSQPIGSTVRGYFYSVDSSRKIDSESSLGNLVPESKHNVNPFENRAELNITVLGAREDEVISQNVDSKSVESGGAEKTQLFEPKHDNELLDPKPVTSKDSTDTPNSKVTQEEDGNGVIPQNVDSKSTELGGVEKTELLEPRNENESSDSRPGKLKNSLDESPDLKATKEEDGNRSSSLSDMQEKSEKGVESSDATTNLSQASLVDSGCDFSKGKWVYDSTGPLYTNNSCPVLTQMQNCQGNGRPDKDYENWRWKPSQCDLPRFDPKKFLELMRGKTIAFIGDSVARNQMESMLCILWQVEVPKNRGNKKMQRYYFRSTSTMIVRIWSSWLVHQTTEPLDFAPGGVLKLHLDLPDETFMEHITNFDVIVLSSGHWFAKQSAYVLNNEIVGGQLWWPEKSRKKKINNIEAFGVSVETILTAMGTHPNYTGLTIVRTFSPDHYEGGAWNTGGSCTGKVRPASEGELVENGFTNIMHEKQIEGFNRAVNKKTNGSKLKLMDITGAFSYRHDGHPGPYRSPDPNKITKRGPDGRPPPQDCLHWCMPGPVDTWNELVFEITRREFDSSS